MAQSGLLCARQRRKWRHSAKTNVMTAFKAWLDTHLVDKWAQLHKMWSVQIAVLSALLQGVWMALPAFQYSLPPMKFVALCMALSLIIALLRLVKQPALEVRKDTH